MNMKTHIDRKRPLDPSPTACITWGMSLGLAVLLSFVLIVFLATSGNAQQTQKPRKAVKVAKTQKKEAAPLVQLGLEPKAIEILKASCSKLAAARTMSFTAVVTYESPSRLGVPLAYNIKSQVVLQRPDKLWVVTSADGPPSEFYYDGKAMVAFAPNENLVAVAEAPSTIDAALKAAYDSAAIYYPFTDLIVSDPYKDLSDGLILAFYIGQSQVVGGTTTDMIAYANNDVFVQAWIGTADNLPRMVRAVYRTDPARMRHQMELSNWQLDVAIPADAFTSKKAAAANPMPFAHPQQKSGQGLQPPVRGKPAKTQ